MNAQIWRFDNANALYYALVDSIASSLNSIVESGRDPVLGLPTGNTMIPFYRIAADSEAALQIEKWVCFNIDEYYPVRPETEKLSFRYYMDQNFYSRLKAPVKSREILNGSAPDLNAECAEYENKIKKAGGIDLLILGLGTNAHIAFNEPGSEFDSRTRPIELHPQTLMANFRGEAPFTHALTLGIGTLLEAKQIFVIAHGKNKAQAVKEALTETPTRTLPATALQKHPNVTWFLDQEASSFI
jgi:glucosamine-6-phosphate deaminase